MSRYFGVMVHVTNQTSGIQLMSGRCVDWLNEGQLLQKSTAAFIKVFRHICQAA